MPIVTLSLLHTTKSLTLISFSLSSAPTHFAVATSVVATTSSDHCCTRQKAAVVAPSSETPSPLLYQWTATSSSSRVSQPPSHSDCTCRNIGHVFSDASSYHHHMHLVV
ncbi:hypothetical protein DEO72_LG7g1160 [Vigna unguiculata]|uniref:Uncharacterized protein n=1 Tax=Vigna unguiculata TaxID=3917 RepID=A0A4D6MGF6_VIGUN|nr:hypothetical protein DEO72_LG7g1160 [Vigna unguiculata]